MGICAKKACENFQKGYNCAQSVLLAFSDEIGLDEDMVLKLSSSFGGGMGRLREVCGAVSAMFMVLGILQGYTSPNDDKIKEKHYLHVQNLAGMFQKKCGSIICRNLLNLPEGADIPTPSKRTSEYYQSRPCENCIKVAAEIIESEILNVNNGSNQTNGANVL